MSIKGDIAIVTGAASGIGQAIAVQLSKQGVHVVLVDINSCEDTISKMATDVSYIESLGDIRDEDFVNTTVNQTIERFGKIHILVNNAGTCCRKSLEDLTIDDWNRDLDTNLKAAFYFTKACVYPHMKEAKYGRIINISSISGMNGGVTSGQDGQGRSGAAYAASKGGIIAFTKWVAKELGPDGITCNSVAPGATATGITAGVPYDLSLQPVQRIGVPDDIAHAVLHFASREASYTTAQVLKVDGGLSIG